MSGTVAEITLRIDPSELPAGVRHAVDQVTSLKKRVEGVMSSLKLAPHLAKGRGMASWLTHAGGYIGGDVAMRGVDKVTAQIDDVMNFNEQLVRFGIATDTHKTKLEQIARTMKDVSEETGISRLKLLNAARAYADVAGASAYTDAKLRTMARTAQSSEADIHELGQVMYQLQRSMKVPDEELEETLGGIIATSKEGAVHFREMSHEIAELAPQAARYGMIGRDGVNKLTAMMQVARSGFGSVSEMGTGITRVFAGITMHADKFEEHGVKIFNVAKDGTKTWRHFADIWHDILKNKKLGKDPFELRKTFGRSEADRTMRMWMDNIDKLKEFEQVGWRSKVVMKDLDTFTQSTAGRTAIAMEKLKNAVAAAFTPERINEFVVALEGVAHKAAKITAAIGGVSDALMWIGEKGRQIRGAWSADPKFLIASAEQKATYGSIFGIKGEAELLRAMQADYQRMLSFKKQIGGLLDKDENTTDASDRLAIRTMLTASTGSYLSDAAQSYLIESGMSSARTKALKDEISMTIALEQSQRAYGEALKAGMQAIADAADAPRQEALAKQRWEQLMFGPGGLLDSNTFDMFKLGTVGGNYVGTPEGMARIRAQQEETLGAAIAREMIRLQSRAVAPAVVLEIDGNALGKSYLKDDNIKVRAKGKVQ